MGFLTTQYNPLTTSVLGELWFYIAWVPQGKFTNRLIDLAPIKTRLIHWINVLHGATGYDRSPEKLEQVRREVAKELAR